MSALAQGARLSWPTILLIGAINTGIAFVRGATAMS